MASKKIFLPLILGLLLAFFIGLTIFGDNGLLHLAGMNQEIHRIEKNIRQLETENEQLKHIVLLLQRNNRYQELMCRRELGMVRKDEKIFIFK
jgi:cell division protein FtsB